jgi:hypothetical protein
MKLRNAHLLLSDEAWLLPPKLRACWNARGLYSPLQFVLRLRPDVHRALNSAPAGVVTPNQLSNEQVLAFSTYLHENIHWWQHVGSTTGLFLSLIYPAQSHLNHRYLTRILSELGPKKSLRAYNLKNARPHHEETELDRQINVALNNWHDIEFYRWLITNPLNIEDKINDPYFECVGHSYKVAISAVLWLLSSTVDPDLELLPDPRNWETIMSKLREKKVEGFYYGSSIGIPPLGAREIFEGQARFSQLQFLYVSSGRSATWDDFNEAGFFGDIYLSAFDNFVSLSGLELPEKFDDPVIALFLLVCDMALNPAECFIEELSDFSRLVEVHDPGRRFVNLCHAISQDKQYFGTAISSYSASDYWKVSDRLSDMLRVTRPKTLVDTVKSWSSNEKVAALLDEDKTFKFSEANLPVRVFLARFIRFQTDKASHPEFFCWPGIWMTATKRGALSLNDAQSLFEEHRAIFLDKEDGNVYPRSFYDREEMAIQDTFDSFYSWIGVYELTRQWLVGEGEFDFDFGWLSDKFSNEEMKGWASRAFISFYGVSPDDFEIVVPD